MLYPLSYEGKNLSYRNLRPFTVLPGASAASAVGSSKCQRVQPAIAKSTSPPGKGKDSTPSKHYPAFSLFISAASRGSRVFETASPFRSIPNVPCVAQKLRRI